MNYIIFNGLLFYSQKMYVSISKHTTILKVAFYLQHVVEDLKKVVITYETYEMLFWRVS